MNQIVKKIKKRINLHANNTSFNHTYAYVEKEKETEGKERERNIEHSQLSFL